METFKVGIAGPPLVGKSSMIRRFTEDKFITQHWDPEKFKIAGFEFKNPLKESDPPMKCNLVLEEINTLANWPRDLNACVLVYDVSSLNNFTLISKYKSAIEQHYSNEIPGVLVGSHSDKIEERDVPSRVAKQYAKLWRFPFLEVSAKSGHNIKELFQNVAALIVLKQNGMLTKHGKSATLSSAIAISKRNKKAKRVKKNASILAMLPLINDDMKTYEWSSSGHNNVASRRWEEVESPDCNSTLMNTRCKTECRYTLELGRNDVPYSFKDENGKYPIEQYEKDIAFYREELFPKEHVNYLGNVPGVGPVVISTAIPTAGKAKAMIWDKFGTVRFFIPPSIGKPKDVIHYIKEHYPKFKSMTPKDEAKLVSSAVNDASLASDLVDMEKKEVALSSKYKIGVLCMHPGQSTEEQIYSNVDMSEDFQDFLNFLGDKIELKGWVHYNGGLDVKNNSTGTHSYFCTFRGFQLMFHVSTLLPFQQDDHQRVERKRHLGNDIVILVFKEKGCELPFDPLIITSNFNHVFVVVELDYSEDGTPFYRVACANKPAVVPYGPFLPVPAVCEMNDKGRDFLLTKLINAERAALHSPEFKAKFISTRKFQLQAIVDKYSRIKKGKLKPVTAQVSADQLLPRSEEEIFSQITQLAKKILSESKVAVGETPKAFNSTLFTDSLQQLLYLVITSDSLPLDTKDSEQRAKLIDQAKVIVQLGKSFASKADSCSVDVKEMSVKFGEAFGVFINLLKQLKSSHRMSVTLLKAAAAPPTSQWKSLDTRQIPQLDADKPRRNTVGGEIHAERAETFTYTEEEADAVDTLNESLSSFSNLKETVAGAVKKADEILKFVEGRSSTSFDFQTFVELLADLGKQLKTIAEVLMEQEHDAEAEESQVEVGKEPSTLLVKGIKQLIQRGMEIKNAATLSEEDISGLKLILERVFTVVKEAM